MEIAGLIGVVLKVGLPLLIIIGAYKLGCRVTKDREWRKAEALYNAKLDAKFKELQDYLTNRSNDPNIIYELRNKKSEWKDSPPNS